MFSRLFALLPIAALVAVVTAAPNALDARDSECNTGDNYCCDTSQTDYDYSTGSFGGILGGVLSSLDLDAGVTCTPISVIGIGTGSSCTQQPVCCTDNTFNGVVNIGCTPINVVV